MVACCTSWKMEIWNCTSTEVSSRKAITLGYSKHACRSWPTVNRSTKRHTRWLRSQAYTQPEAALWWDPQCTQGNRPAKLYGRSKSGISIFDFQSSTFMSRFWGKLSVRTDGRLSLPYIVFGDSPWTCERQSLSLYCTHSSLFCHPFTLPYGSVSVWLVFYFSSSSPWCFVLSPLLPWCAVYVLTNPKIYSWTLGLSSSFAFSRIPHCKFSCCTISNIIWDTSSPGNSSKWRHCPILLR